MLYENMFLPFFLRRVPNFLTFHKVCHFSFQKMVSFVVVGFSQVRVAFLMSSSRLLQKIMGVVSVFVGFFASVTTILVFFLSFFFLFFFVADFAVFSTMGGPT